MKSPKEIAKAALVASKRADLRTKAIGLEYSEDEKLLTMAEAVAEEAQKIAIEACIDAYYESSGDPDEAMRALLIDTHKS